MIFFQSSGAPFSARSPSPLRLTPPALFMNSSLSSRPHKALVATALAAGVLAACTIAALFVMPLAGYRADESRGDADVAALAPDADEDLSSSRNVVRSADTAGNVQASPAVRPTGNRVTQQPAASGAAPAGADELSIVDPRWSLASARKAQPADADQGTADYVVVSDVDAAEIAAAADSSGDEPVIVVDETAVGQDTSQAVSSEASAAAADENVPSPEETAAIPAPPRNAETSSAGGRNGRITKAVNLRAGPDNGARVLGVIPARATVRIVGCKMWCTVEYGGRRGYIFKSFVR